MLYKEYDPKVLKKLQAAEIEILIDFANLCEEHEIDYFCCGGTLLGTIRHKGFIPWDDDIDLGMTREHYDKFLSLAGGAYGGKYQIMNAEVNPSFPGMNTKWYVTGTSFLDKDAIATGYSAGIGIDIFCFDNVADDKSSLRSQALRAWGWGKVFILRNVGKPTIYEGGIKGKIIAGISVLAHGFLRLIHLSPRFIYGRAKKAATRYQEVDTKRVAFLFDPTPYTSMIRRDDIYPTQLIDFENIKIKCPSVPEAYLRTRYGADYMTPPPDDKKHNHPPLELDFGEANKRDYDN